MLGQGGFGKVLSVTRSDSGERFAMKAILKQASASAVTNHKMVRQAQVERRILRRVSHPFIIDLHCAFQTHDKLLLVLEICPGGDLKSQCVCCSRPLGPSTPRPLDPSTSESRRASPPLRLRSASALPPLTHTSADRASRSACT